MFEDKIWKKDKKIKTAEIVGHFPSIDIQDILINCTNIKGYNLEKTSKDKIVKRKTFISIFEKCQKTKG